MVTNGLTIQNKTPSEPFGNQTCFDHLKTGLFRDSDPDCTSKKLVFDFQAQKCPSYIQINAFSKVHGSGDLNS